MVDMRSETIANVLAHAEDVCAQRTVRLTPLRRRVLELIFSTDHPVSAYQLLDKLVEDGRKPAPPTIYRTLDFLLSQKFIHRLATQNTYVGCDHLGRTHMGLFLVCQRCKKTVELIGEEVIVQLGHLANQHDFSLDNANIEIDCLCQSCRKLSQV